MKRAPGPNFTVCRRFAAVFLCVPSCPLWLKHFEGVNHKGHEGTQRKTSRGIYRAVAGIIELIPKHDCAFIDGAIALQPWLFR